MAICSQNAFEFIRKTFAPQVSVLYSKDADLITKKSNLTFVELLQPFCRLKAEGNININLFHSLN